MEPPDASEIQAGKAAATILDRVRREGTTFTAAERRVAGALLGDYPVAGLETVARFARRARTSGPTILRFVGRLGFGGYPEFQDALRAEIQDRLQSPLSRHATRSGETHGADLADRMSEAIRSNIAAAARDLSRDDLAQVASLLSDPARSILCIGGRFSWMVAAYFHHYLRELRPGVRMVRDNNAAWADYLLDLRAGDVLVAFDFRRYQRDVLEMARGARAQGAVILLVTDPWLSPVAPLARIVIRCPVGLPGAFDSGATGLAMVEILTASVVEALGHGFGDRLVALERLRKPFNLVS